MIKDMKSVVEIATFSLLFFSVFSLRERHHSFDQIAEDNVLDDKESTLSEVKDLDYSTMMISVYDGDSDLLKS